jgi:hypothetical protein
MNALPYNTALGYVYDEEHREHITNTLFMPIVGGSDGGLFTCAADLVLLWKAILSDRIFSSKMREQFFTPHGDFGLGVYLWEKDKAFFTVGGDFGVDFFSLYHPRTGIIASALGNTEGNTWPLLERLVNTLVYI